jgi:hypothetical protein
MDMKMRNCLTRDGAIVDPDVVTARRKFGIEGRFCGADKFQ